jgi:hypothetical protein
LAYEILSNASEGARKDVGKSASEKYDPKMMSSTRMTPASVLQREMKKEVPQRGDAIRA